MRRNSMEKLNVNSVGSENTAELDNTIKETSAIGRQDGLKSKVKQKHKKNCRRFGIVHTANLFITLKKKLYFAVK